MGARWAQLNHGGDTSATPTTPGSSCHLDAIMGTRHFVVVMLKVGRSVVVVANGMVAAMETVMPGRAGCHPGSVVTMGTTYFGVAMGTFGHIVVVWPMQ